MDVAELQPVYLIHGNDRPKVGEALRRLRARFPDDAIETYAAATTPAADVVAACSMMGLLADQRLMLVTGVDAWKADDVAELLAYMHSPGVDTVLVLTADKLRADSKLLKAFKVLGKPQLIEVKGPEKPEQVVAWIAKTFAGHGVEVPQTVARRMAQICGVDSLDRLATDIEKIVVYADGEPVTVEMVDELATPDAQQKVWELTDAWASRDRSSLLRMTEQLLGQGEHPVRLVGILGRHVKSVHQAKRLLERMSPGQVQSALVDSGANQWAARKYVEQAQRIHMNQADASLARVALLEAELKGAAPLASGKDGVNVVLERGLCELL